VLSLISSVIVTVLTGKQAIDFCLTSK
jgi:hypothetical protein